MDTSFITPAQCRAARQSLGLSLKQLTEEAGVNRSYLSMFENGKMPLSPKCQQSIVDFFESRNIDLEDLMESPSADLPRAKQVAQAFKRCFILSAALPQDQYDRARDMINKNDERLSDLLGSAVNADAPQRLDQKSELIQREIFGLLAANYLLFRLLQGFNIAAPSKEALGEKTQGDLLADWFKMDFHEVTGEKVEQPPKSAAAEVQS